MAAKGGTTEYAVLGMLALGPGSGYDLKKRIEGSIAHFWSESYGQIYPILAHLASQGLVERRLERQKGKPDRQVYSITAEGQERLGAWLTAPARRASGTWSGFARSSRRSGGTTRTWSAGCGASGGRIQTCRTG